MVTRHSIQEIRADGAGNDVHMNTPVARSNRAGGSGGGGAGGDGSGDRSIDECDVGSFGAGSFDGQSLGGDDGDLVDAEVDDDAEDGSGDDDGGDDDDDDDYEDDDEYYEEDPFAQVLMTADGENIPDVLKGIQASLDALTAVMDKQARVLYKIAQRLI